MWACEGAVFPTLGIITGRNRLQPWISFFSFSAATCNGFLFKWIAGACVRVCVCVLLFRCYMHHSPTRLALGFLQLRIDLGSGLSGKRFPRALAAVPPIDEAGSPRSWTSDPQPIDCPESCNSGFGINPQVVFSRSPKVPANKFFGDLDRLQLKMP